MRSRHDATDDNSLARMPITRDGSPLLLSPLQTKLKTWAERCVTVSNASRSIIF